MKKEDKHGKQKQSGRDDVVGDIALVSQDTQGTEEYFDWWMKQFGNAIIGVKK